MPYERKHGTLRWLQKDIGDEVLSEPILQYWDFGSDKWVTPNTVIHEPEDEDWED